MIACWSCGAARPANAALCPACNKVQPPPAAARPEEPALPATGGARRRAASIDKFAFLGFDPGFDLDIPMLEERFRGLSRKLHPDRFARATPQERRFSLEQTTLLNDAYKTLRDPVRRAEHLLQLRGVTGEPKMSPAFLEETIDDREKLLEAKMSGAPLDELVKAAQAKRDDALKQVRALVVDGGDLQQAAELLARMKYYARYLDEAAGKAAEV
jgi:molecular chaperone HscB